jgi:hypothetical protein
MLDRARTMSSSPRLVGTRGRRHFLVGDVNPCADVFFRCTGRTMSSRTLPVALPRRGPPARASWRRRTEDPFHGSTPMPPLPRSEAPSTDKSLSLHPLLALRVRLPGRHWSHRLRRRGPASDTRSPVQVRARSCPRAGYSPELARPRAAYRLLQCMDSRARPPMSRPHRFIATDKPPHGG